MRQYPLVVGNGLVQQFNGFFVIGVVGTDLL
jgi:hypothetical protein